MKPLFSHELPPRPDFNLMSKFSLLLFILALALNSGMASAQTDVGHIVGTVTDKTGAVVAGAAVHITNQENGLTQEVTTNQS